MGESQRHVHLQAVPYDAVSVISMIIIRWGSSCHKDEGQSLPVSTLSFPGAPP